MIRLQPLGLLAIRIELFAELGMRDLNQRLGPLANGLAVQVSDSIFGHNIADESSRSDHSCAGIERWHNPRNRSLLRGRRDRNDGFAAFRPRCATQEIHLAADA